MKNNTLQKRKINLGIEILRFLCCFWINFNHVAIIKKNHQKYLYRRFHVPIFILISFYFNYHHLIEKAINKIISRFQRLLIPYVLWPIIILILNNFLISKYSFGEFGRKITLKDFLIQIIIGHRYHLVFWFQFFLIFTTLIITILSFIFKKNILNIILLLGIISFNLTISRLNYNFFSSYGFSGKNLGSVIDLMPIVAIGCIFSSMDILSKIKHFSKYFYLLLLNLIFLLFEYDIFVNIPELRFSNVLLFLSAAVIFFILFGSISFDKIKNKKIILILMNITKFTGGIY